MPRVLIIGAHTAVAKALRECLEERDVDVELLLATTSEHLQENLVPVDEAVIDKADLVILALAGESGRGFARAARARAKPVLDLTESLVEDDGQWIFPGLDADAGRRFDPNHPSLIPIGLGVPLVTALRALKPLGPTRASIVTSESTAVFDQSGMDELSAQLRARFNMREIEPQIFPAAIAFGVIPGVSSPGGSPSDREEVLRSALESGLEQELPDLELFILRTVVPTFSADSAVLIVDVDESADEGRVRTLLAGARGLHLLDADEVPSSFDAVGREDVLVGRVQTEAGRIGLWMASDRLRRGSATLAALVLERFLEQR